MGPKRKKAAQETRKPPRESGGFTSQGRPGPAESEGDKITRWIEREARFVPAEGHREGLEYHMTDPGDDWIPVWDLVDLERGLLIEIKYSERSRHFAWANHK